NCTTGKVGKAPLIYIASGLYSSTISQSEADTKADSAWNELNTQSYANINGICTNNPYIIANKTIQIFTTNYHDIKIKVTVSMNTDETYTVTLDISSNTLWLTSVSWNKAPIIINGGNSLATQYTQVLSKNNKGFVIPSSTVSWVLFEKNNTTGSYGGSTTIPSFTLY
ncbi:DUF5977 domain-containing protein, partial [Arsenicibacter rosenii]|uniref:DUF5977 domain-containing protein n=1 Tax=Arsenicibacter rosenii TaxID=1750698 RepID=UPI0015A55C55